MDMLAQSFFVVQAVVTSACEMGKQQFRRAVLSDDSSYYHTDCKFYHKHLDSFDADLRTARSAGQC